MTGVFRASLPSEGVSVKRSAAVLLVLLASAVVTGVPQAYPKQNPPAPGGPTLLPASEIGPSHGGQSGGARGWLPLHPSDFARAKADANARAHARGSGTALTAGTAPAATRFANVSPSFSGTFFTGGTPPDTTGAIGPDRYIETVNTKYAIYSRTPRLLNSGPLSALTGLSGGLFGFNLSDPQMMWDAKTQRFYYAAVYYDAFLINTGLAVGWSKTATPASSNDFCKYVIQFNGEFPDYPKLGDSSDFLIYGYNEFGNFASRYDGSAISIVNKPPAGTTCAPTSAFALTNSAPLQNADGSLASTPVPANLVDDSNGTGYVIANADLSVSPSANFISLYSITTNGTNSSGIPLPAISAPTNVAVPSYSMPSDAPQNGSSYLIDTLDGRFKAAVAAVDPGHGMAVWASHAVFGGAGSEERWYEIDPNTGSLFQSGVVTDPALDIWNGAIAPDRANNGTTAAFGDSMAMSVSTSSPTTYPAIQFLWKTAGAAQTGLHNIVQSAGADVDLSCSSTAPCRWGDYSGASPDPAATGTIGKVWLANQYNLAGGTTSNVSWRTWIFGVTPSG
jgi:hypothetical protein